VVPRTIFGSSTHGVDDATTDVRAAGTSHPDKADTVLVALRATNRSSGYRTAVPVRMILGDSLPPGLYRAVIGADSLLRGGYVSPEIALR
jgi:hypothetical protein